MEILDYENDILSTSAAYNDSTAFQRALSYIKKTNAELYAQLLEVEGEECGVL